MKRLSDRARSVSGWALADCVVSVAVATGVVAALDSLTAASGLGVVYLLAVLFVAIRRGEVAALATAVLGVASLNYFFIEPRHRLTISDSEPAPWRPRHARAMRRRASAKLSCWRLPALRSWQQPTSRLSSRMSEPASAPPRAPRA
jgi:hypothetical protein